MIITDALPASLLKGKFSPMRKSIEKTKTAQTGSQKGYHKVDLHITAPTCPSKFKMPCEGHVFLIARLFSFRPIMYWRMIIFF